MKYYILRNPKGFQWWVEDNPYYRDAIYPETFKDNNRDYPTKTVKEIVKLSFGMFYEVTEKEFIDFVNSKHNFIFNRTTYKPLEKFNINN